MAPRSTVGSIQVADFLEALRKLGVDPIALPESVGLAAASLEDSTARILTSRLLTLLEAVGRQNDPLVGLHAGARVEPRDALFYLLLSSTRVSEGLRLFTQFARVSMDKLHMRVTVRKGIVELTTEVDDPAIAQSHHAIDYIMGSNLSSLRRAIPGFRLLDVTLTHEEFGERGETARTFGCPVHFGHGHNALRFADSTLRSVPAAANPAIAEQIKKFTSAVFARITFTSVQDRVTDAIRGLQAAGLPPDRAAVAKRLHTSERTLQRQLEQESTSFKILRDNVRSELARALLANRALNVETIALSVGFADVASFSKAFTRWSGHSPTRYREQLDRR